MWSETGCLIDRDGLIVRMYQRWDEKIKLNVLLISRTEKKIQVNLLQRSIGTFC